MPLPKLLERYTYQDYLTWDDGERWELIEGVPYNMTPAPRSFHQTLLRNLTLRIGNSLSGRSCQLFFAPIDVVFSEHDVVQPDLVVVCDPQKVTERNIQGAPDLIIEILSPSTALKDRREKKALYQKHGVKEYLLVDPEGKYAERFLLEADQQYGMSEIFDAQQVLHLSILPEIEINLWEIFEVEKSE